MRRTNPVVLAGLVAVALAPSSAAAQVEYSGEVRVRSVWEHDLVIPDSDVATLLRSRFMIRALASERAGAVLQLQDARVLGEETSTLADGSADQIDLHQAYAWWSGRAGEQDYLVRAGRQEVIIDNERLIGAVGWSNTGRSFDGARLDVSADGSDWSGSLFAATVAERGRNAPGFDPTDPRSGDHALFAASISGPKIHGLVAHDPNATQGGATDVDRTTLSGRWGDDVGAATVGIEAAYQFGSRMLVDPQDISAWFFGARAGLTDLPEPLASLTAGVDVLSGDDDLTDDSYGAFNTLYATNHKWYGLMDLFLDPVGRTGDRGLIDALVTVALSGERLPLTATIHRFMFAEGRAVAGRSIGWELDVTAPFTVAEAARLLVGYGVFRAGGDAAAAGLGPDGEVRHWGFVQMSVGF